MSDKTIYFIDKLSVRDTIGKPPKRGFYRTQITVKSRQEDGSTLTSVHENETVMMGRLQLLENMFDVSINRDNHLFLNDNIHSQTELPFITCAVSPDESRPLHNKDIFKKRKIKYFCVGNGAESMTSRNSTWPAHDTNTNLYNMIPFRLIPDGGIPLTNAERDMYKLEVPIIVKGRKYKAYYLKKLISPNDDGVVLTVDGNPHIPKWSNTVTDLDALQSPPNDFAGGKNQQIMIHFVIKIDKPEFEEWYIANDNTTANASISEVGLVSGLECDPNTGMGVNGDGIITDLSTAEQKRISEVWDAELVTHLVLEKVQPISSKTKISFDYKIYS